VLGRPLHASWFIALAGFGAIAGIGLSLVLYLGWAWWVFLIFIISLGALIVRWPRMFMAPAAIIIGLLLGLGRGGLERVNLTAYSPFMGHSVALVGTVAEDPDFGIGGELRVKLTGVHVGKTNLPGTIWASATGAGTSEVKRSDRVTLGGKLKAGFANFPATMSYAKLSRVERGPNDDPARDVRDAFGAKLESVIKAPASDLGMGILAGAKRALPTDISDAFKAAGLTHIVVASGYNLSILVRFARRIFGKISRFAAAAGAGIFVLMFAAVTGWSPSMTRAAVVAILSLLAWYYGRKTHPIILLAVVAAGTALVSPYFVWGDAGWYMSFLSFAGVIILSPMLQKFFFPPDAKKHSIRAILCDTLSATVMTLPIIALFMGTVAPFGLVANLLVLPIVPLAMLVTFLAGMAAILIPPLAAVVAPIASAILNYMIRVAQWVAGFPYSVITISVSPWLVAAIYAVIFAAVVFLWRKTHYRFSNNYIVE
jgi:competence protein ComEC